MNISPSNPFTGLKGALAGLMSGGWLGLLLGLLFRRRIAPMLAALESLFAQWKAGTLPVPAAPGPVRAAGRASAADRRAGPPAAPRVRAPAAHGRPVEPAVVARIRVVAWGRPAAMRLPVTALRALLPLRRRARCTKNGAGGAHSCTP
jgi:hypothetical protein